MKPLTTIQTSLFPNSQHQQGFTLAEMMVAVGIMSMVILGVVYISSDAAKMNRVARDNADLIEVDNLINKYLSNPEACAATLNGLNYGQSLNGIYSVNASGEASLVPTLKVCNSNLSDPNFATTHVGCDSVYGNLQITSMTLTDPDPTTSSLRNGARANLVVSFHKRGKAGKSYIGPADVTRTIPLLVDNCQRVVVHTSKDTKPVNDPRVLCRDAEGEPYGPVVKLDYASGSGGPSGGTNTEYTAVVCRLCRLSRGAFKGCIVNK